MEIKIIVGANYGDEGKGLMTDYVCRRFLSKSPDKSVLNVMHNGGPQRGHTVQLEDGTRFTFRNLGAATFAGADTYMASMFLVNPATLREELEQVRSMGYHPKIFINMGCRIITPYDMIANQVTEEHYRRGSCGCGIWKTIQRNATIGFTVKDLIDNWESDFDEIIGNRVTNIQAHHRHKIISGIGFNSGWYEVFNMPGITDAFIEDMRWMLMDKDIFFMSSNMDNLRTMFGTRYECIIFENAQGLAIDGKIVFGMEYNTPSDTDLVNPTQIIENSGYESSDIEVIFVSRTYLTRHGKGLFVYDEMNADDLSKKILINDPSNVENEWQGKLRHAPFDEYTFREMIIRCNTAMQYMTANFRWHKSNIRRSIALTHYDELHLTDDAFEQLMNLKYSTVYISTGPAAIHIVEDECSTNALKKAFDRLG